MLNMSIKAKAAPVIALLVRLNLISRHLSFRLLRISILRLLRFIRLQARPKGGLPGSFFRYDLRFARSVLPQYGSRSGSLLKLLQNTGRVLIVRVELQSLLVVNSGKLFVPVREVGFAKAVVNVRRMGIQLDVHFEDHNCLGDFFVLQQRVPKIVDSVSCAPEWSRRDHP